jgi:hypothetical protein
MPSNLIIVNDKNKENIVKTIQSTQASHPLYITNGTYAYAASLIVPTVLAGFEYIADTAAAPDDPFVIAVNSDHSMRIIMENKIQRASSEAEKEALRADLAKLENETVRAEKVAVPLALQHPGRAVIVVFYDEETPTDLYRFLQGKVFLSTLFKYGYGTDPKAPRIEGADCFKTVLAFPLIKDPKPICYDITASEDKSRYVQVVALHGKIADQSNSPYLSENGKILFPVRCEELLEYSDSKKLHSVSRPKPY